MKFTQEIKDKWLEALKSGKYKQGYFDLEIGQGGTKKHCCIGVLGDICNFLSNSYGATVEENPYKFLENNIGRDKQIALWKTNDNGNINNDYSNVIPLIEALEVQD